MRNSSDRKNIEILADILGAPIPTANSVSLCIDHIKHLQQSASPLFQLADATNYITLLSEMFPDTNGDTRLYLFDLLLLSNSVEQAATIARDLLTEKCLAKHWEIRLRRLISIRLIHEQNFADIAFFILPLFVEIPTYDIAELIYWASAAHNKTSPNRFSLPKSSDDYFQFVLDRMHAEMPIEEYTTLQNVQLMNKSEIDSCVVATLPELSQTLSAPRSLNQEHYLATYFRWMTAPPIRAFEIPRASIRANEWSISIFSEEGKLLSPASSRVTTPPTSEESYAWLNGRTALIADAVIQSNYCHWMLDTLPRVLYLKKLGITNIDYWLVGALNKSYQKESLVALGIDVASVVSLADHPLIKTDDLIALSDSSFERRAPARNAWPELLRSMRQQFYRALNIRPSTKRKRILISRKDAGPRVIHGEDELFQTLQKEHGFERYRLSELSFAQQVQLFADAEAVIGAHGAGLTNVLFCQPYTTVIEILNPRYGTHAYAITAQALELQYSYICGKPLISGSRARETYHNPDLGHEDFLISTEEHRPILNELDEAFDNASQKARSLAVSSSGSWGDLSTSYIPKRPPMIFDFYPKQGESICKSYSGPFLEDDIRMFFELGESLPANSRFAQIGGQSTLALLAIGLGAKIHTHASLQLFCVDPSGPADPTDGRLSRELLKDDFLGNSITLLKVPAQVALTKFADASLDALLIDIDGDVSVRAWKAKLKDDGRFFFYSTTLNYYREAAPSDSAELALLKLNASPTRRVLELA